MQKELFLSLLAKYKADTLTQEEWTIFREQVKQATYDDLLQLDVDQLLAVRQVHPSWSAEKEDKIWTEVQLHTKVRRIRSFTRWMAAAAVLVIGLLAWWLLVAKPKPDIYMAKAGERKTIELPDGSRIQLNSGSTLTVAPYYNDKVRMVTLDGEGYFEVKHSPKRPFILRTAGMQVIDMGTVFNVRAYSSEATEVTSLVTGKVKIVPVRTTGNAASYILQPMQKLVVYKAPVVKHAAAADTAKVVLDTIKTVGSEKLIEETAWREMNIIFNNTTLRDVAAVISQQYGVEVVFEKASFKDVLLSGRFRQVALPELLEILCSAADVHYRMEGKKVVFY